MLICIYVVCIQQNRVSHNKSLSKSIHFIKIIKTINKAQFDLSPPVKYFTDCSKAVLLLCIFYVFVLSCVCYVSVCVCLYVLRGHLLGKG